MQQLAAASAASGDEVSRPLLAPRDPSSKHYVLAAAARAAMRAGQVEAAGWLMGELLRNVDEVRAGGQVQV